MEGFFDSFVANTGITQAGVEAYLWSLLPNIISCLITVVLGITFYMVTARLFEAALRRTPMQESLIKIVVRSMYRALIFLITFIFVLSQVGVNVTAALAGVGVLGIAVGFAAQQTLANIFSGFAIFIDHLYKTGDWVTLNGHSGEVVAITLRTTKIRTLDNTYISVPNSLATASSIVNYSEKGMVRISASVRIPYQESIEKARQVLMAAMARIDAAKPDPEPDVVVEELMESGVKLLVRIWIDNARLEQKYGFILTETCKKALEEAGITIPFPQRDIHMIPAKK